VGRSLKECWLDCWSASLGFSPLSAGAMLVMSRNDRAAGSPSYRLSWKYRYVVCLKRNCEIQQIILIAQPVLLFGGRFLHSDAWQQHARSLAYSSNLQQPVSVALPYY
jgi:hypothetical protein